MSKQYLEQCADLQIFLVGNDGNMENGSLHGLRDWSLSVSKTGPFAASAVAAAEVVKTTRFTTSISEAVEVVKTGPFNLRKCSCGGCENESPHNLRK